MARKQAKTYAQLQAEIKALMDAKEQVLQDKCKTFTGGIDYD